MKKWIWFDMDGTIADLYGVGDWLDDLNAENARPYKKAKSIGNLQVIARKLNKLQKRGYKIGIISWLSKNGSEAYGEKVAEAKKQWLKIHLGSVKFDRIDIVPYGEPKQNGREGILFDDEIQNRKNWNGKAYEPNEIAKILGEC